MARICPKGKILRKAYTRKAYTKKSGTRVPQSRVPGSCIKDLGKKGKGKKLFTLRKGTLGRYGYKTSYNTMDRHVALRKAVEKESYSTVVKKLNAVAILQKRTNPKVHNILIRDMEWVMKNLR